MRLLSYCIMSPRSKASMPASIAPQLCTALTKPPSGEDWQCEIKWDGYRLIARLAGVKVRLITRNGHDWSHRFPKLSGELAALPAKSAFIDGELCALNAKGVSDFGALQAAIGAGRDADLVFYVFDLMFFDGQDLRLLPLTARRERLEHLVGSAKRRAWPHVALSETMDADPVTFYRHACKHHLEGIICKQAKAPYRSGRNRDWVKVKCSPQQELVIGGYTLSNKHRGLAALLLGHYEGSLLVYDGRVGSGFSHKGAADLLRRLRQIEIAAPALTALKPSHAKGAKWVRPELVCEVRYTARTNEGYLRQASFKGLREDKSPRQVGKRQ